MPVLFACFGFAVDIAAATLTSGSLQSNADAATQSVVSQSKNAYANNKPGLSANDALAGFVKYYDANRKGGYVGSSATVNNNPFLHCQGTSPAPYSNALPSRCGFKITSFQYSNNGTLKGGANLRVSVQEQSNTLFLRIMGINTLTYNINSNARLGQSFQ